MTRERAKELLPVIQAWAEGKVIQAKPSDFTTWIDSDDKEWSFENTWEFRIKPTPREFWIAKFGGGTMEVHDHPITTKCWVGEVIHVREVTD